MEAEAREALKRMGAAALFAPIETEMERVEARLQEILSVEHRELREMSTHLVDAGGKRVRPALAILCGRLCDADAEALTDVAVVVELVHMATLVHDDVLDGAQERRGLPSIHRRWNNTAAILLGDYLFASAFSILADLDEPRMVRSMAQTVYEMCSGEIQQLAEGFDLEQDVADYYQRINRKTAFFIAETCRLGAMVGAASPELEQALRQYGYHIGMGFQIVDDVLDLTATVQDLGKPIGSDLRGGLITLPVIYGLRSSAKQRELTTLLEGRQRLNDETVHRIRHLLEECGAFRESYDTARGFIQEAKALLAQVPESESKEVLAFVADFIVERTY